MNTNIHHNWKEIIEKALRCPEKARMLIDLLRIDFSITGNCEYIKQLLKTHPEFFSATKVAIPISLIHALAYYFNLSLLEVTQIFNVGFKYFYINCDDVDTPIFRVMGWEVWPLNSRAKVGQNVCIFGKKYQVVVSEKTTDDVRVFCTALPGVVDFNA